MTTHVYLDRSRISSRSPSSSLTRLNRGLEAFVLYGLLPAALVIGYLVYATFATG